MKPMTLKERSLMKEDNAILEEDTYTQDEGMSDEDLKIESLKIATNICKLMNDVTPEDIMEVAEKVAKFIKNGGNLEVSSDNTEEDATADEEPESDFDNDTEDDETSETEDFEEDFSTNEESEETPENEEDESSESEEDFEV